MVLTSKSLTLDEFIRDNKINPDKYKELWGLVGSIPDYKREKPKDAKVHIYSDGKRVVGAGVTMPLNSAWKTSIDSQSVFNLEVPDKLQGKGIGSYILKDLTKQGKWVAGVHPDNYKFYEKQGFKSGTPDVNNSRMYTKGFTDKELKGVGKELANMLTEV